MLDQKVFITRTANPWPDLFERWWDGAEWLWVNHGRPMGTPLVSSPGAAMINNKLFVVSEDGKLWERHWRLDLNRWVWFDHGRPNDVRVATAPGAAMMDEKFFVATEDGDLWERHWRTDLNRWAWFNHGRPNNEKVVHTPGAAMMDEKLFVVSEIGNLWERHWRSDLNQWVWSDHGRPNNEKVVHTPGAPMMNEKLFVVSENGNLWERHWRSDLNQWVWNSHGRPPNTNLCTAPGAAMADRRLFVGASNGRLYERFWNTRSWKWVDHGEPPGTRVSTEPAGAMLNSKLFVGTENGRMFERYFDGVNWVWVDHGKPLHDRSAHVLDNRGGGTKKNIAVIAEGYTESNMHEFRNFVQNEIVGGAFAQDLFAEIRSAFNMVRIELVSLDSGVSQRRYDEKGTPSDSSDDTIDSETYKNTRLGYIFSGSWAHCWMEPSTDTNARTVRALSRFMPNWDFVIVVMNESGFGGCRRGTTLAVTQGVDWATVGHELGHSLGDLADEYSKEGRTFSGTTYARVNCSVTADRSTLKWVDKVDASTPLPTTTSNVPSGWDENQDVGAFEGCGTYRNGLFRPVIECRMNQNRPPFCPICAEQLRFIYSPFI